MFLAGPTPRDDNVISWRKEAIKLFDDFGFSGTLFVPERRNWKVKFEYTDQVEWELKALENVDKVMVLDSTRFRKVARIYYKCGIRTNDEF